MSTPLVSIITPCFNSETWMEETVASVLAQDFANWELLLIDDGSTDSTPRIAAEAMGRDARIAFIRRPSERTKGPACCRNIGIERAQGAYIMFLDSDDLLEPFCLKQRVVYMESRPDLDMAVFQMRAFDAVSANIGVANPLLTRRCNSYIDAFLSGNWAWQTSGPIWRKPVLTRNHGFCESCKCREEDPELHARVLLNGCKFEVLPDAIPDCNYRRTRKPWRYEEQVASIATFMQCMSSLLRAQGRLGTYRASLRGMLFRFWRTLIRRLANERLATAAAYRSVRDIYMIAADAGLVGAWEKRAMMILNTAVYRSGLYANKWFLSLARRVARKAY